MNMFKNPSLFFKGFAKGNGKRPIQKVDPKHLLTFDEVKNEKSFGAILQDNLVDVSCDTDELSQKLFDLSDENDWNCLMLENPSNGHIHSIMEKPSSWTSKDGKDIKLAVGLIADIHSKGTYIPLKVDGVERTVIFEPDTIDEVPVELFPVKTEIDLLNLSEGDGRNDSLFRYILILQGIGLDPDQIRQVLDNTNRFILAEPLSQNELDTITRDEAFDNPIFYSGKVFLHNIFGDYLIRQYHIARIDGRLHIYQGGMYTDDLKVIHEVMRSVLPTIKKNQKTEVLDYISDTAPKRNYSGVNLIAFNNGILDINTGELLPFSPDRIVTNKIPWDYYPSAYDEQADLTLNRIACSDPAIRSLLEECIGYTFYRVNNFRKAFILTGSGSNGKSTFISVLNRILGDDNVSAMDLKNLGDRFSKATLFKKLANIGDDISDEFISDPSLFKKIVSGDRIQAEFKGQDAFEFNPYVKLIFSANSIPRMKDKTGAVINRLVIIPFKAVFSDSDPDFDPDIKGKLCSPASIEYFIRIGVEGLNRVLKNKGFTKSSKVQKELDDYEEYNNPVIGFFKEQEEGYLFRNTTKEIHLAYSAYCHENGYLPESSNQFGRTVKAMFGVESKVKTVNGKSVRMYVKENV